MHYLVSYFAMKTVGTVKDVLPDVGNNFKLDENVRTGIHICLSFVLS